MLAVNFGDAAVALPATGELLFTTPTPATVDGTGVVLPPHAGVLMRLDGG